MTRFSFDKIYSSIKNYPKPTWLLPSLILLLAAVLRFVYLGIMPSGLHQDEAFVALNSFDLFHEGRDSAGNWFPVYTSSWGDGQSALYSYLLTLLLFLNGGIPTPLFLRIPQALVGTLTVLCVYLIGKQLFNRNLGLWASFLLAICPWHITMSRWALDANLAPGFLIFGFFFMVRSFENKKFLPLAGLFYGLSLYCYAVIWLAVPIMLLLQIIYGLYHKKLTINPWSISASLILFIVALPLILFVFVNMGVLSPIYLPFMTIPEAMYFRGSDVTTNLNTILSNAKAALRLFVFQEVRTPYDIIMPWGLFYDIGRIFIVIGTVAVTCKTALAIKRKLFAGEVLFFIQLLGGGITCLLVTVSMHQINSIYIPLVLCQAYGIYVTIEFLKKKSTLIATVFTGIALAIYLICLILFQKDYYTDYQDITDSYFAKGVEESVYFALEQCESTGIDTLRAEKATQWPRILLYTQTLPSEYFREVEYDVAPHPQSFVSNGLHIYTRIDYTDINTESIYIIYFTEVALFKDAFELTQFDEWYVAVPKDKLNK